MLRYCFKLVGLFPFILSSHSTFFEVSILQTLLFSASSLSKVFPNWACFWSSSWHNRSFDFLTFYSLLIYALHMVTLCFAIAYYTAMVKGIHEIVLNSAIFSYQLTYHLLVVYLLCKHDSCLLSTGICWFSSILTTIVSYS